MNHMDIKENILGVGGDKSIDIELPEVKAEVNSQLGQALEVDFLTPYMAIERISNVLSKFHIPIPKATFLEGDHGFKVFDVIQFGHKFGMNDQGEVVQKDECSCSIYFEYQLNTSGTYDVFAEIVTEEELAEILSDVEEEENIQESTQNLTEMAKLSPEEVEALRLAMRHLRTSIKKAIKKKPSAMKRIAKTVIKTKNPKKIKAIISKVAKNKKTGKVSKPAPTVKKKPLAPKPKPSVKKKPKLTVKRKVAIKKVAQKALTPKPKKPKAKPVVKAKTVDKPKKKLTVRRKKVAVKTMPKTAASVKRKPKTVAVKPKVKAEKKAPKKIIRRKKASVKETPKAPKPKKRVLKPKEPVATKKPVKSKVTKPSRKKVVTTAAVKKVVAKRKLTPSVPAPKEPLKNYEPKKPTVSLYKASSIGKKVEIPAPAQSAPKTATFSSPPKEEGPAKIKEPPKPRNAFEIAWDKSAAGPNHTHPQNAKHLRDIAHAEMQKHVARAQGQGDYDALNNLYSKRMGMIKKLGHHYTETAPYDHIVQHIKKGTLEPDHVILSNMHAATKREHAIGAIDDKQHRQRLHTLNKLSKIVHGTKETTLIPGVDPDSDSKHKSIRRLHGLLSKFTRNKPVKVFSEQQIMENALEIMNKQAA